MTNMSIADVLSEHFRCADLASGPGRHMNRDESISGGDLAEIVGSLDPGLKAAFQSSEHIHGLRISPAEILSNLRLEKYVSGQDTRSRLRSVGKSAYYAARSFLPFSVRAYLKRLSQLGWRKRPFPAWPIDRSADRLLEASLQLAM